MFFVRHFVIHHQYKMFFVRHFVIHDKFRTLEYYTLRVLTEPVNAMADLQLQLDTVWDLIDDIYDDLKHGTVNKYLMYELPTTMSENIDAIVTDEDIALTVIKLFRYAITEYKENFSPDEHQELLDFTKNVYKIHYGREERRCS